VGEIIDASKNITLTVDKPPRTIKNAAELTLTLTPTLSDTLLAALPYLAGYPYGCNEQVLSRFLPSVMVASAAKKLDLDISTIKKDLPDYIKSGLMVLYKRQHDDNGWGWYEYDETDSYMTAYVLYGLLEAKRLLPETEIPITVDESVIKKGTASLISQLPSIKSDSDKVYALYVLSYTDKLKTAWLDEMFEKRGTLTPISRAMLLLAYENKGIEGKAKVLYDGLMKEKILENGYAHWGYTGDNYYWWDWEADPLETTAYVLRVMARRDVNNPLVPKAIRWLIVNRTNNYWVSTRTTGKIIEALSDYLTRTGETSPDYNLTVSLNGTELKKGRITKNSMKKDWGPITVTEDGLKTGTNTIEIKKAGKGNLYYSMAFVGYTASPRIAAVNKGFEVKRTYYLLKRQQNKDAVIYTKTPLSGPVRSGDEILVEVTVKSDSDAKYFLLEDYYPAGCEAVTDDKNYTIPGDEYYTGEGWWWWFAGREYRDERIAISMDFLDKGEHKFTYILRAQNPGTFSAMPAEASLMYFPDRYGRSENSTLVINEAP
jgi:alpha-2-macroglobulin